MKNPLTIQKVRKVFKKFRGSQAQIARDLGKSRVFIHSILNGKGTLDTTLLDALRTRASHLLALNSDSEESTKCL